MLSYTILNFFYQDQPAGQIITSIHPNGQGYIEQVVIIQKLSPKTNKSMIKTAVRSLCRQGASHIRVMTFEGNEVNRHQVALLKSTGFFLLNRGMGFVFLSLKDPPAFSPDQIILSRLFTQGHN